MDKKYVNFLMMFIISFSCWVFFLYSVNQDVFEEQMPIIYISAVISVPFLIFSMGGLYTLTKPKNKFLSAGIVFFLISTFITPASFPKITIEIIGLNVIWIVMFWKYITYIRKDRRCKIETTAKVIFDETKSFEKTSAVLDALSSIQIEYLNGIKSKIYNTEIKYLDKEIKLGDEIIIRYNSKKPEEVIFVGLKEN